MATDQPPSGKPSALSRRDLLKVAGITGVAGAAAAVPILGRAQTPAETPAPSPATPAAPITPSAPADTSVLFFFNDEEARFVTAVIDRLIPADDQWPGAVAAGVLTFIDRQLAGPYGAGARTFLGGPWVPDAPATQGYQHRFTPAELIRIGIAEMRPAIAAARGQEFWDLGAGPADEVLTALEEGTIELPSLPSKLLFSVLLDLTMQGWFGDPAHGGNRDMVSWKMIGFPGAYAQYLDLVDVFDLSYSRQPISIANSAARTAHLGHEH